MKLHWDHPLWQRGAPVVARTLVTTYLRTCPCDLVIRPEVKAMVLTGRPVIYTTWHCHLLFPLYYVRRYYPELPPMVVMASPSRDGRFIAEVAQGMGFTVCYGSTRKGGVKALKEMAALFRQGYSCGMIADGSRGPARVAQKGMLYLARETGAPILPVVVAARRKVTFDTWDAFELPLPFSRLALLVGEPLPVRPQDRGPALEPRRLELETRLNRLSQQGQFYFSE